MKQSTNFARPVFKKLFFLNYRVADQEGAVERVKLSPVQWREARRRLGRVGLRRWRCARARMLWRAGCARSTARDALSGAQRGSGQEVLRGAAGQSCRRDAGAGVSAVRVLAAVVLILRRVRRSESTS